MKIDARQTLFRVLRRSNWTPTKDTSGMWVRKDNYFVLLGEKEWTLYVKLGRDLIQVHAKVYGRRQSQDIKKIMEKDQRVRQRCIPSSSKVDLH